MRKPSPAMIVASIALFAALSGVGVAANGGSFILGHANSATLATSLSAPVSTGKALQVTNSSTTAGSTALGLNVAAGHAPFTVNSGVKVANLNADLLDGVDSTALQRRVSGTCPGDGAMQSIATGGTVTCSAALQQRVSGTCSGNQAVQAIATNGTVTCLATAATPTEFYLNPEGFSGFPASQTTTVNGYTLTATCSLTGSTAGISLSLSYSGGNFNFTGGGIKGSTPFSWEYNGYNGNNSNYTILTDSSTTAGAGHIQFEAGHYGSAANILGQVGYGVRNESSFSFCEVMGSLQPAQ